MHSEGRSCPGLHSAGPALCRILPSIRSLAVGSAHTGWALSSALYMDLLTRGT